MPFGLKKTEKRSEDEEHSQHESPTDIGDDTAGAPADDNRPEGDAAYQPMAFRPSFLDDSQPGSDTLATVPATAALEGDAVFVSVAEDGQAQVHYFDGPAAAQKFVEEILAAGTPEESVTVFIGQRLALKVSHRPVVSLASGQKE